jgi:hypothetical protein
VVIFQTKNLERKSLELKKKILRARSNLLKEIIVKNFKIKKDSLHAGFPIIANDDSDAVEVVSAVSKTDSRFKEAEKSDDSTTNRNGTSIYFNEEFDSDQEVD